MILCFCGTASADTITGTTSLGLGQVGVSVFGTDFFGFNGSNSQCDVPSFPVSTAGCFDILSGTGTFASLVNVNAQINTIQDLPGPPLGGAGLSGPNPVSSFISFHSGAVIFDLLSVLPGGGQNCATVPDLTAPNASCTVYVDYGSPGSPNIQVSPYLLTNGPDATTLGVSATMYFNGYTGDANNGTSLYRGIFSTQLSGVNIFNV